MILVKLQTAAFSVVSAQKKKKMGAPNLGWWEPLPLAAEKKIGGAPNSFKNFHRAMRIMNMCLVLKLDNGKVVPIANEQTHIQYCILI